MKKVRNKRRSHAETLCLSISALYSKQRDHQTLRAARLLRMTDEMSSRSVSTPVIPQCLYAGYRSFLLRPILRIETLRNDGAAGIRGFTLVELLVVVLIIGILSAIAIPMYQGAVDKSHWSTMLPASKAIKDAEEAFKMTNGEYSDTMEHLDVQISNNDLTFTLNTPNNLADPNVIRVTNSKLGDKVRLASYLDASPLFAGQLHCEAKTGDERAIRLCDKLLQGDEIGTGDDNYTRYIVEGTLDRQTCGDIGRFYGQKTNTCYKTNGARCVGLGMPYNESTQFCGYTGEDGVQVQEGGSCQGHCRGNEFYDGAQCFAGEKEINCWDGKFYNGSQCTTSGAGCSRSTYETGSTCTANGGGEVYTYGACSQSTFTSGSKCIANASRGCGRSTFTAGAKCIANIEGACSVSGDWFNNVTYDGGCCEGLYCPSNVPKC